MSDIDFFTLLGVTPETSQRDIDRVWRKTALKYHPDKFGNDPIAKEDFHLAQIGHDLLSDPAVKALYDSARNARLQRERKNDLLKGRRRTMVDDLFARERGTERSEQDGRRKSSLARPLRSDKIRSCHYFSRFGKIESVDFINSILLKSGKSKKRNKKQPMMIRMVQYASVVGSHAAVEDFPKQQGPEWECLDPVFWAANKEPDFIAANERPAAEVGDGNSDSTSSTPVRKTGHGDADSPSSFLDQGSSNDSRTSTPLPASWKKASGGEPGLVGKKLFFASFSSVAALNTPPSSGKNGFGGFINSPSLEDMIMIRLKNAEKKRSADEIQKQDEAAAAEEPK
ncbi:hypothetical protein MMC29_008229 [Sticta canariensis]|nr:hypothetical protein [Sticta canariensis]